MGNFCDVSQNTKKIKTSRFQALQGTIENNIPTAKNN